MLESRFILDRLSCDSRGFVRKATQPANCRESTANTRAGMAVETEVNRAGVRQIGLPQRGLAIRFSGKLISNKIIGQAEKPIRHRDADRITRPLGESFVTL